MKRKVIQMRSNKKSDMTDELLKKYPNVEILEKGKVCNSFGAGGKKYYQSFLVQIKDELKGFVTKKNIRDIPFFGDILNATPLETRLKIFFEMQWLAMNIVPERFATDSERKKAVEYGKKMTKDVIEIMKRWEKDGRPKKEKELVSEIPKNILKEINPPKIKKKKPLDPLEEKMIKGGKKRA